ncbi:MAG: phenylacetate-CoA oxygenase subunit PaaJ [Gemmatimonadaceae bacterium]|nr:phenylacetate-CoA oxygenase subunit PaaJ [Gemmatimonadaceae bacterium]
MQILETVKDPEVPVLSVVELGIVRDVTVAADGAVEVAITPTYSGCPAMHAIEADITTALHAAGHPTVRIRTVFNPAWTTEWIGEAAREKLRAYGIAAPGHLRRGEDDLIPLLRGRTAEAVACPYCGAKETDLKSEFGTTACKSIRFCNDCRQPFEQFKAI